MQRMAILTSGGDAPGLNGVIRAFVKSAINDHGWQVVGVEDGFEGMAVRIQDEWHGDGGIRLSAPLSPALHLGAHKILAVSSRYVRTQAEAGRVEVVGYPPPAQVLGVLLNAVFLDLVRSDKRALASRVEIRPSKPR